MKNLKIYAIATSEGRTYEECLKEAEKVAVDSLNTTTFFALRDRIVGVGKDMESTTEIDISALRAGEPSPLVLFDFLSDDLILCMIFESGAIYTVDVQNGTTSEVGLLPGPICGGAWSPDLQLLSVASEEMLFTVSRDFDVISEEALRPAGAGKDQLMTVGWGSRETQFQGAAGRQQREKADVNKIPVPTPESDDRRVIVSWRADAQFFAVSGVEELPAEEPRTEGTSPVGVDARQLRVWNREGELMARCEVLAGMEPVLAMKPNGNIIATTRVLAGVRSVWFFERNGQYRHHFDIGPAGDLKAESISWNLDSSVLTVHLANAVSGVHQLQFWTVSNYDWSLKLQLNSIEPVQYAAWDPENAHRFHLLKANGRYERIELDRVYNCEDMIAISASGKKLRVTDLKLAPVPPPMSHYELELPSAVVGLCQSDSALAVLTSDGTLTKYTLENRRYIAPKTVDLAGQLGGRLLYGLQWKSENVVSAQRTSDTFEIVEIGLEAGKIDVVFTSSTPLAWHAFSTSRGRYICEFEDGKFAEVEAPAESSPLQLDGQQVDFKAVSCHKCQLIDSLNTVVGLSRNHQLIVNGNVVHSAVGSYGIAGDFLLAVTLTNTLFAIPFADVANLRSGNFPTDGGRAVERGAALLDHEPYGTRVWLQMPRGNLEVIQPRVLLVQQLKRLLDGLQFADALKQMRRHRVDMNLLYDHNPETFLLNVNKFVDQVDDADLLNLFILTVTNEDSTTTLFAAQYPDRKPTPDAGKVAKICVALRQYLLSLDTARLQRLYTATLSCFVKEGGAKVSDALSDLQRKVAEANGKGQQLLEKWLRHLTYLVDERTLFNQALRTYDLKIALTVIQASEQDPKEYLALLNELDSKTPEEYRRYHIDLRLEDWPSALEHIARVDERFDECVQHIKRHDLYSKALSVFRGTQKYKEICSLCAEHSLTKARYDEAALLFQRCDDTANALKCYELARDHRKYVELAEARRLPREQIVATLKKLVPQHESRNNFAAVADMLAYIDEEANAARIVDGYCKTGEWQRAVKATGKLGDDTRKQLEAALKDRVEALQSQCTQWSSDIERHSARLEVVRDSKHKQLREWMDAEGDLDVGQSEVMSEASTTVSNMSKLSQLSRMSTASAKRRKNIDKKKKQLREGSQYEDAALLVTLKDIYAAIDRQIDELKLLLPALVTTDLIDEGRALQTAMFELVRLATSRAKTIWPRYLEPRTLPGPLFEIYRCEDGIVRLPSEGIMPPRVALEDEMVTPRIRNDTEWRLEILK